MKHLTRTAAAAFAAAITLSAAAEPTVSVHDETTNERRNPHVAVLLSEASESQVTVAVATADGTAKAGADYLSRDFVLTFAPGETGFDFALTVVNDAKEEQREAFLVRLSDPVNATLGDDEATVTIMADSSKTAPPPKPLRPVEPSGEDDDGSTEEHERCPAEDSTVGVRHYDILIVDEGREDTRRVVEMPGEFAFLGAAGEGHHGRRVKLSEWHRVADETEVIGLARLDADADDELPACDEITEQYIEFWRGERRWIAWRFDRVTPAVEADRCNFRIAERVNHDLDFTALDFKTDVRERWRVTLSGERANYW